MSFERRTNSTLLSRFQFALVALATLGLITACNKKNDDRAQYATDGNVETDGSIATSNTIVNGIPLNMSVSNIQKTSAATAQGYNLMNGYNNYQLTGVQFTVNINGVASNLTVQPKLAGTVNNTQTPYSQLSAYNVYYDARCMEVTCTNVYLVLWVTMQNSQQQSWKQMGIYKNMQENKIGSSIVREGIASSLPTIDTMIQQLQSVYENR